MVRQLQQHGYAGVCGRPGAPTWPCGCAGRSCIRAMSMSFSASAYAAAAGANTLENVEGDIVLPPGTGWLPLHAGAGTSVLHAYSVTWEEIPI